ncbi:MAG: hypothetical protein HYY20_12945 [Candidatus Tectomicrobia bacterium]|uniref:Uncharacterized protein n=1 Tax=Tectimicrobiota bacterium TaxID=2528274 RepID=A0A932CR64_UNCTE|nr:hypothetical protein [Candidatus Tectomicrobia bacterium]
MNDSAEDSGKTIIYRYKFAFDNGREKEFEIELDRKSLALVQPKREAYPQWVELKCLQCPICPLEEDKHRYCPIAENVVGIIEFFGDLISYERVYISIRNESRTYEKCTTLQKGVSSLLGIYMVTSGCPIMDKLRPMVCYHLPFATPGETRYRAMSMYLMAQYLLYKRGREPDWDLKKLVKIYDDIQVVNRSFCKRLANTKIKDATINALVILDNFANYVTLSINGKKLSEMEALFSPYFDE